MPSTLDQEAPPGGVAAAKGALAAAADASAGTTPEPNVPAQAGSGEGRASSASSAEVAQLEGGDVGDSARTMSTVVLTAAVTPTRLTVKHEPRAEPPQSRGSSQPEEQRQAAPEDDEQELRVVIDAKERLRWSPQLHSRFCQAVAELGGCAFAKPKDIVTKMNVPGLTLAHVKSHLQKYRQQEGVTYVPHGPRGGWGRRSSPSLQAPIAATSNAAYADWQEGPAAKRMRTALPAFEAPPAVAAPPAAAFGSAANLWPAAHLAAPQLASLGGGAAEPLQQYIKALSGAAAAPAPPPMPPPMPAPAAEPAAPHSPPAHEAHADRLHALADLALAQQQELAEADTALQAEAAAVESAQEQLAAALPSAGGAASELAQHVEALAAEQQAVAAEVQRHLAAQAQLLERLAGVRRAAQELLMHPALAQAAAPAAEAAAQQAALAAGPAVPAGTDLHSLLAMVAAAAAGRAGGQPIAGLLPHLLGGGAAGPHAAAATAGLAQLQHLYQNAALLAARQG